jgi:hypothetical protein
MNNFPTTKIVLLLENRSGRDGRFKLETNRLRVVEDSHN